MKLLSAKQYSPPTRKKLIVGLLVGSCLLAISHLPQPVRSQVSIASVISVFQLTKEVVHSVIETWDLVEEVGDIHLPFKRNKDEKILKRMFELSLQIERSEHKILSTMELTIGSLVKQLSLESVLENQLQDLADLMNRVSHRERLMRSYLAADEKVETHTLEDFAQSTVAQDSSSVLSLLARIELLVSGSRDLPFRKPGVLELLLHATQNGMTPEWCEGKTGYRYDGLLHQTKK